MTYSSDGNDNDCDNHWGRGSERKIAIGDDRDVAIILAIKL